MTENRAVIILDRLVNHSHERNSLQGLDEILQQLSMDAAKLLDASHCSIMLSDGKALQVYAHFGELPDAAYREVVRKGDGISGHVYATGKAILINNIKKSEFSHRVRHPFKTNNSLISAPILIDGKSSGVINVHGPISRRSFGINELRGLKIFASIVGQSVQTAQLRSVLHSRFAIMSISRQQRRSRVELLANQGQYPGKIAKILAKSFYRELRKAGFGSAQIINAATEIISELGKALQKKHDKTSKVADINTVG